MDEISPGTHDNQMLANMLECVATFTNGIMSKLDTRPRAALHQAIFAGAKIQVVVQLNPYPEVKGMVESGGETTELFAVSFPPEAQPILN